MIAASTICGRISPAGFTSIKDRRLLESMRDRTDASIIGAGTLRDADPEMRCTGGELPEGRIRAFVSASGQIPFNNRKVFVSGPKPVIFVPLNLASMLLSSLENKAVIVGLPESENGLSMNDVLTRLYEMGARRVLIEGGGSLNHSFLSEGLVDEILLTIAPFVSGEKKAATVADSFQKINGFIGLELLECNPSRDTGEIFTRYRVIR